MKKFIISSVVIILFIFTIGYLYYVKGIYLPISKDDYVSVPFRIEQKLYTKKVTNKRYEPIEIKGVEVGSTKAFHQAKDFKIDVDTWLKWFEEIQAMGANTIKINTIYNSEFYNALYKFNSQSKEPLYLLQGIRVSDDAGKLNKDAYDKDFIERLKKDSLKAVDVVHGRSLSINNSVNGNGFYRNDISQWVIGYLVGEDWDPDVVAYTNEKEGNPNAFAGEYFYTKDANKFEVVMAKVMERLVKYETEKYNEQRPISFLNTPLSDPFEYKIEYAEHTGKYNKLNIEHIYTSEKNKAGLYAAYKYDKQSESILTMVEDNAQNREILHNDGVSNYLTLLENYHKKPIVIVHFNIPSVRSSNQNEIRLSEKEQGTKIVEELKNFKESKINHAIIHSWQDTWYLRDWNTAYAVDQNISNLWHDAQTETQHYGLMAFEPYRSNTLMRVDGNISDWKDVEPIVKDDYTLSITSDHVYMYFLIQKDNVRSEDFFIGMDFLDELGTTSPYNNLFKFNRPIDFLIHVNGEENTEIFVHERYNSLRQNFLESLTSVNPYINYPQKDSTKFVPIEMIRRNPEALNMVLEDNENVKGFETYNTGKLIHGDGNPNHRDYNSYADFSYGENNVEIRIPYFLLNFYDSIDRMIHKDYYENYGVEPKKINKFFAGIALNEDKTFKLHNVPLKPLEREVKLNERLKDSYYEVKMYWGDK